MKTKVRDLREIGQESEEITLEMMTDITILFQTIRKTEEAMVVVDKNPTTKGVTITEARLSTRIVAGILAA
jgi:acetyl-CoA carboxylase beta subunit